MMKKTFLVLLLTTCIVFSCLAFAARADGAPTISVAASGGDYTTVESALSAVEQMAAEGELTSAGVRLVLTGEHTATAEDGVLFGQKTIFLPSGLKLPITVSGGTLRLPAGNVVCTNDYTFTDIRIPFDDVQTKLYAGTGNVVLGNIITDLNGTDGENKSRFYGDNFTANAFLGWDEDKLALYTEDGLFTSSMTLGHGFKFAPKSAGIYAAVGSSTDFSATVGTKTISADDTCPKMIIDGAEVGHSMVKAGAAPNPTGNAVLHVKSGTIGSLRAGGHLSDSKTATLKGDMTVIVDGGKLWDFPRLLRAATLDGDLNVTFKNVDLMENTTENGKMIQIAFGGSTINGDLTVYLENVKADRYYGALSSGGKALNGDLSFTAKNCEFSQFVYSGLGAASIAGNVTNTLENVELPFYRGLDECTSLTGNVTTSFKNVTFPDQSSMVHVYMGSVKTATVNGNFINTMEGVNIGDNVSLYMGTYGGTLNGDVTSTVKSGVYGEYFYGATNTGVVNGTVTNNIEGGIFLYETYLSGFYTEIRGKVVNNVSGGTFNHYLFGGTRSGKVTNTTADYTIRNYFSGGTFKGVWGGSGGGSATHKGNVYNEITGGTFSTYSTDNSKMNSFAGGCRNTKQTGNANTLIRGGIFEGWVAGGSIPNDDSYSKTSEGNTLLTLAGGDFRHTVTANCRWGTYTGETLLNVDTEKGLEPLKVAATLECNDVIAASDTYELALTVNFTAKNIVARGSKTMTLNGKVTTDTFTVEKGAAAPCVYGSVQIGTLNAGGETILLGAKTRITALAVNGEVTLHQTELWSANTYFTSPADTVIHLTEAEDAFGRVQLKNGVVKGLSSSLAGVAFVFADNVSLRFAFDKEWAESVKSDFSFTAKAGAQTIVDAAKFSDLILKDGYYTVVSEPIETENYNADITYSGTYIPERSFKMTELAATGIKVYDKAGQYPELANLLKAFSNYAVATDNYKNERSTALPYENLATSTDFHLLLNGDEENGWDGMNHLGTRGNGYMSVTETAHLEITGRQFILDDGMRVRYTLKGQSLYSYNQSNAYVHKLYFWSGCENITSTITKTWVKDSFAKGHYEITVDIPVYPSHTGGGYVRFFVTEQATLNNSTTFVVDHIDRIDALAEELADISTATDEKELGSTLQYYLQAAAEYYPTQPNMENFEYPETFSAGYAIGDISPYGFRMQMYSYAKGQFVIDPMYITCLAMWDGNELALYYSFDTRQCDDTFTKEYKAILSEKFGVDPDKIFFNATHNHSSPDLGQRSKENVRRWYDEIMEPTLYSVTKAAILDLAPTEVYAGKATSDPGTNYVRRYFREDGSFTGIHVYETAEQEASPVVRYESEADKELRTLRFDRGDGKKDIVLANWQGHAAHGANQYKTQFTGDFVYHLRKGVQENMDVHFIYCNGASGNLNFTPKTEEDKNAKYFTGNYFEGVGQSLAGTVEKAVAAEEKVNTGAFLVNHIEYVAPVKVDDADLMEHALEVNEACKAYTAANGAWTSVSQQKNYIFNTFNANRTNGEPLLQSTYHLSSLMTRNSYLSAKNPTTHLTIDVFAFAFGDVAMGFVPYEQFDTNAKQTRDGVEDLYKITITGGYTNGTKSYVPSNLASIDNTVGMQQHYGGYEVYTCRYEDGTGDGVAAAIKDALRAFKAAK